MKRVTALSVSLLVLSVPSLAFADADDDPSRSRDPQPVAGGTAPNSAPPSLDKPADPNAPKDETDDRWHGFLDVMLGFGATPIVSQKLIGPLLTNESRTAQTARFTTQSFNIGLAYDLTRDHDFKVGAMLPLGTGSVYPDDTRGATVIGNVELGAEYRLRPRQNLAVDLGFELALPTASGDQLPDANSIATGGHLNQTDLDRHSLLNAMAASRGREDTAAFSSDHLGLVPHLGATLTGDKTDLEGFAKYESLHAVRGNADYEGSIVVGGRLTYHLTRVVDGTLRVWANIAVAGADSATAVAEPQLAARLGWVTPVVGVVLPFAGELTSPYVVGVRLALLARF